MSDWSEMADGPTEPAATPAAPEPPYIRYTHWEPLPRPKTGPELLHAEVDQLRNQVGDMTAAMQKMQESICHLELQVHRLLNQEGEL